MSFYRSNLEDPYITLPEEEAGSDDEDDTLRDSDLLILAARNDDDVSHLEVWVYEEPAAEGDDGNLYVHHDVMLPAFPLAVAWLDCDPAARRHRANLAAVGTFSPGIEIGTWMCWTAWSRSSRSAAL
jgi:periodic tryptophan protein 1